MRARKCHRTKHSNGMNYRSSSENFQNPINLGCEDFFWDNPFIENFNAYDVVDCIYIRFGYMRCNKENIRKQDVTSFCTTTIIVTSVIF